MAFYDFLGLGGKTRKREKLFQVLFDANWYLEQHPEVLSERQTPLQHYLTKGEALGFKPNRYFDPEYYVSRAPGAAKFQGSALEHFALKGWKRGRNPSKDFSTKLYFQKYPEMANLDIDPLSAHFSIGRFVGSIAFPLALEEKKMRSVVDAMQTISDSGLFDADWYLAANLDVRASGMPALYHFARFGAKEMRQPNPVFASRWYQDTYGDKKSVANPLIHYIKKGVARGNNPAPDFCANSYRIVNEQHMKDDDDPLLHFLTVGLEKKLPKPAPSAPPREAPTKDLNAQLPIPGPLRNVLNFEAKPLAPEVETFDQDHMKIHWVVPAFAPGGGGHMTIFRMVHFLEVAGHNQTLWINDPNPHDTVESIYQMLENHFQHFTGDIKFVDDSLEEAEGDAIIATDCWTVFPVMAASNFKRRFYFVQDFEPSFHPMGSNYLLADQTYRQDLDCLCASPWLAQRMENDYGRWARHFWLAADQRIYHPAEKKRKNKKPRIAVYARHFTARRAVELAFMALEKLSEGRTKFAVDFFGAPLDFTRAPFEFVDHGVASQEELARIFQKADVGLVFSATNYSLVPQEMMACGLPIVELDVESTRAIFPEDVVTLATPHPTAIADALRKLLKDKKARKTQADAALEWVSKFSWKASANSVEAALKERVAEFGKPVAKPSKAKTADDGFKASVVIPTLNAGSVLEGVLEAVVNQTTPWPFEVLVIDSGSTDGTLDTVAKHPSVRLHQIDKKDFNHGATRNLGAELTTGEFIAYLTHDAMPVNDRWLYNMVSSIEQFPNAAGAFGKHFAWPEASAYTKRDLNNHFQLFSGLPIAVSKSTDEKRWKAKDQGWLQALHFYSDNNSCFRREVWEKIPYRKVTFGEDQLWAWDIIKAGYQKVYAPQATVYHSHDYDEEETFERSKIESAFFKHFFDYELMKNEELLHDTIDAINHGDREWGFAHDVDDNVIDERMGLNIARLKGYLAGVEEADEFDF
ncbi:MAG: glycosyltransferase [Kordiimonadaceae bacterium]|nr:glycosyltransferase [Kordiimonadaceae bacterium]MBO6569482.1 glycosyltransferase [Kordiimonadaceae bacterium]MBO6964957.1 glycosyltransferase [Kordiimonadaceae bacterium]